MTISIYAIKRVFNKVDLDYTYHFVDFRGRMYAVTREEFLEVAHSTAFILGAVVTTESPVMRVDTWLVY